MIKAADCFSLASACGLETVAEAILNVEIHSTSLFRFQDIQAEISELYTDTEQYDDEELIERIRSV